MRVPLSWLRSCIELDSAVRAPEVATALITAGVEVQFIEQVGAGIEGPVVVGQVAAVEEADARSSARWCTVAIGGDRHRQVCCVAPNFAAGDPVIVALPGAVLPGGYRVGTHTVGGRVSEAVLCSPAELGLGDDRSGVLVLRPEHTVGSDAVEALDLHDTVLDVEITPDRGYCLSIRGLAREISHVLGGDFRDPADIESPLPNPDGVPVEVQPGADCDRFGVRTVDALDPSAHAPWWLRRRLLLAGTRSVSLVVDVTNYVMIHLGQPLHAFDRARIAGGVVVRNALPGQRMTTLDGVERTLDPDDMLVTDGSAPIALAGVMGSAAAEVVAGTTGVILEAAHYGPAAISRAARRHRLPTEAARRFERGVDPELVRPALQVATDLLVRYAGGQADAGLTVVDRVPARGPIDLPLDLPQRVIGLPFSEPDVLRPLRQIGCGVSISEVGRAVVRPPTWRPDLTQPFDLLEEIARLRGYDAVPSVLPRGGGRGLTPAQRARRQIGRALATAGYVEALSSPFQSVDVFEQLRLPPTDPARRALRLSNPLASTEPLLRTMLLPGLLQTVRRNLGRGLPAVSLYERGIVYLGRPDSVAAPALTGDRPPTTKQRAELDTPLPRQPWHLAAVLAGGERPSGWRGARRQVDWADAVSAALLAGRAAGTTVMVHQASYGPWHPGRCAELRAGDEVIGYAGELHPTVLHAWGLPARTCAMELDLDRLLGGEALVQAPHVSSYPPALIDLALLVKEGVPAADVAEALRAGTGELLESLHLFDVYTGAGVAEGYRSLAYTLRLRASDRTLSAADVRTVRDSALDEVRRRTGAVLRT